MSTEPCGSSLSSGSVPSARSPTNRTPVDHEWRLIPEGEVKLQNVNSGMSTADSAQIVQFQDNGTPDHNWRLM
jgi:hypothetical protein